MHVKFEPIQRSWLISKKNADSAGPRNIMNFQHFFKVHQISSNLQNLLESSSETCMWNFSPFREVYLFLRKMPTVPALEISWNFNIFSKFTKFHQTCRTYLNHHQKHACEIWAHSEKLTYYIEKCRQCRPFEISWNFNIFSKFTKISLNLQNLLESSSETCMWNFSPFREVDLFHRKIPTVPAFWNIMKFQYFFKSHQISSNLQNIFESSSETCMWNLSPFREVNLVHRKMLTVPALWNIMKFQHFFKVHQISSNLQNLLESSSETCMWNLSPFREVDLFQRKMPTVSALEISWNFNIFSKFTKYHQTCRIYWNHHQKHACEIWAHSEKLTYFKEKCRQCRP